MGNIQPTLENLQLLRSVYTHFDTMTLDGELYFSVISTLRKLGYTNVYRKAKTLDTTTINGKLYLPEGEFNQMIFNARHPLIKQYNVWLIDCILSKKEQPRTPFDFNELYTFLDRV